MHSSRVIVLADPTHSPQCMSVLIWTQRVNVVEWLGLGGVSIAGCKVHSNSEVNLTTTHHVVQEGVDAGTLERTTQMNDEWRTALSRHWLPSQHSFNNSLIRSLLIVEEISRYFMVHYLTDLHSFFSLDTDIARAIASKYAIKKHVHSVWYTCITNKPGKTQVQWCLNFCSSSSSSSSLD